MSSSNQDKELNTLSDDNRWLSALGTDDQLTVEGLVLVTDYDVNGAPPEEVVIMEKAAEYGAHSVFFEAGRNGKHAVPQAFIFLSDSLEDDESFAETHKKLWSWSGVPLLYRKLPGIVQLFRCAHGPDFIKAGEIVCNPIKSFSLASNVSTDPWWNANQLRNGTMWDDAKVCKQLLSSQKSAHKSLIDAVKRLHSVLNAEGILPPALRRKLLILSLLIAYLEQREVFKDGYLARFSPNATKFFQVLADGPALVSLLEALETRFNGHVFTISENDRERLRTSKQLGRFSRLIEGREQADGQLTLWRLYSFKDLPVELISHIYQLFVDDVDSSVYTPPFLVRLMLSEVLDWNTIDNLHAKDQVILDPACGSGVFLVEAYKRLVLHWRSRNNWQKPSVSILKTLLGKINGIDLEEGAIELAAFSLCLALCDALEPEEIRASIKLFPQLAGKTLHHSCFFEAKDNGLVSKKVGVIVGNPPFISKLRTEGSNLSYKRYGEAFEAIPDKQVAYLFLHEAMDMLAVGGTLCMLQQYNFLYNQQSENFRRRFFSQWDVREILDFISVRGLFQNGGADTKIIVVIAQKNPVPANRKILHATFRRSGRADAEQGFDIDYYDLHWIARSTALSNDGVWRANLLGGGRALNLVDRLKTFGTLQQYAQLKKWDFGEGFIEGASVSRRPAPHITGAPYLPSEALTLDGVDETQIDTVKGTEFRSGYTESRFTPPMILVRAQMDLPHVLWTRSYLTYSQRVIGFSAPKSDLPALDKVNKWLNSYRELFQAYTALISPGLFIQKATALQADDIYSLPYSETADLDISENEQVVAADVVNYYRDLVRLGEKSEAMEIPSNWQFEEFSAVLSDQINAVYQNKPLVSRGMFRWPGVTCMAYSFGDGKVDWNGAEELRDRLKSLLEEQRSESLWVTRISRLYDANFVFLLKPDRTRYWLKSVALRDADEILADLRLQGF